MPRSKSLEAALAIALALLAVVIYVTYFYDALIDGSYVLNLSVTGASFDKVAIELPTESGEPIYRLRSFSATVAHAGVTENVTPALTNLVRGYPTRIEIPYDFSNGDYLITGDFTLEPTSPWTDYGANPWRLEVSGQEYLIDPGVRESLGFKLVLIIKEYSYALIPALIAAAAGLTVTSIVLRKK